MFANALSKFRLGSAVGIKLVGAPKIVNSGQMHIGRNFFLASRPVISHLITESTGVLRIGDDVSVGYGAAIYCEKEIRIGDGTKLAPYCVIADTDFHVIGDSNSRPEPRPIVIGRNVSIGAKVNVLPGSTIGDGAVVIAGSTVAGNVPAGAVVSGVPAVVKANQDTEGGTLEERVRQLVRDALGLPVVPADEVKRSEIPQWDSLGALRITLGVEGLFAITLAEREVTNIHSVGDLIAIVQMKA